MRLCFAKIELHAFSDFFFRYLLALRHKSLPAVPDVLPILSGSTELTGVGEVQFYVDQDTVYVVDAKIEVCSLSDVQLLIMPHFNAGALWHAFCKVYYKIDRVNCNAFQAYWPRASCRHEMSHLI